MQLLLDTHIWLWGVLEPDRISARVASALEDPANEIWLSPISIWETMLLAERKRIDLGGDPHVWVERALSASSPREAALTYEVAARSASIKIPTRDPADRLIGSTAAVHGLTLVTADKTLAKTKEFAVLPN